MVGKPVGAVLRGLFKSGTNQDGELVVKVDGIGTTYVLNWQRGRHDTPFAQRPGHISLFEFDIGAYRLLDPNKPSNMSRWAPGSDGRDRQGISANGYGRASTRSRSISTATASPDAAVDRFADVRHRRRRLCRAHAWVQPDDGILVRDLNRNAGSTM